MRIKVLDKERLEQPVLPIKTYSCVVTGQQAGLFSGPAYTILKGITCVSLARHLGVEPIFWLATEDHDVDEIDHAYLLDPVGNMRKFRLTLPKQGQFVEDLTLNGEHWKVIEAFSQAIGKEIFSKKETSYAQAIKNLLLEMFQGTGLKVIEPKELRHLAIPFFKKEIQQAREINAILKSSAQKIADAPLKIDEGTNLFLKMGGKYRRKIVRAGEKFQVGREVFSEKDLLTLIDREPERFSTNAAARCVLQNSLLPLAAYVAGPTELSYYRQLKEYHAFHSVQIPWLVPRLNATFITPQGNTMLEQCGLDPWDEIPRRWIDLRPDLAYSPDRREQRRWTRTKLKESGIPIHSLHYLNNLLNPHLKLQERVLNWWEFQRHSKENLIQTLLDQTHWNNQGHHYCYL